MNIDPSVRTLLLGVMRRFPESRRSMVRVARENRTVELSTTSMLEEFARDTQRAVESGRGDLAAEHLNFISERLLHADDKQYEYIDVYYVEGILYGVSETVSRELWQLMPENLRALYVSMWGTQNLPLPPGAA